MDAGAPGVYRDVDREELLDICNENGVLYAWVSLYPSTFPIIHPEIICQRLTVYFVLLQTRYQLLWDRIIEKACAFAFSSIKHKGKGKEVYKHYDSLRSLHWKDQWVLSEDNEKVIIGQPEVDYQRFLAMLEENTLILPVENLTDSKHRHHDSESSLERSCQTYQ